MMKKIKLPIDFTYAQLTLLLAIYFALVINLPFYSSLYSIFSTLDHVSIWFAISIPLLLICVFNLMFNFLSWPIITKPIFTVLLLLSSMVSYAGFNYGTIFDQDMVVNIVETNSSEATSYMSLYSIAWILFFGVLPSILLWMIFIKKDPTIFKLLTKKMIYMAFSLLGIVVIALFFYQDYASVGRNNQLLRKKIIPTHFVTAVAKYTKHKYFSEPVEYAFIGLDAKQSNVITEPKNTKPTLIIFMLGETARAQNYNYNGYKRDTNQYSKKYQPISFQHVKSCGTATAVSVPCLFSNMSREDLDSTRADNQDNVIDVLKRAGVDMLWEENDGGDKGVAKHIPRKYIDTNPKNNLCNGKTCFDMALIEHINQDVESLKNNRIVFLHLIGSHGPTYFERYPKSMAKFKPDCPRADIENCSVSSIVNTYDNTILYTDFVMAETIKKLVALEGTYNTALIYVSDHGESLGEKGLFLHGIPYGFAPEYQTHIPLIVWMSDGFKSTKKINSECLKQNASSRNYSHENIFHSLVGIMDVTTEAYLPNMDMFLDCRS